MAKRHNFEGRAQLAVALSDAVARDLNAGIAERGGASLAVSGGTTPTLFFNQLANHADVDWTKVTITLVDERWVGSASERSNARLVKQNLLQGAAFGARFVPLYAGGEAPTPEMIAQSNSWQEDVPHPLDAVVLGMGTDGHTASFFPGGDTLDLALSAPGPLIAISAPGAGEPRITMTLPHLLATNGLYLHIEGEIKAEVLAKAQEPDAPVADMPVRAVLRQKQTEVQIYWCP